MRCSRFSKSDSEYLVHPTIRVLSEPFIFRLDKQK